MPYLPKCSLNFAPSPALWYNYIPYGFVVDAFPVVFVVVAFVVPISTAAITGAVLFEILGFLPNPHGRYLRGTVLALWQLLSQCRY